MRKLLTIAMLMFSATAVAQTFAQLPNEVVVVQINAEWNDYNTRIDLEDLEACDYRFGWLEEQPKKLQETIRAVPVVVIYVNGVPRYQYSANLSFKLTASYEEIQNKIYEFWEE